MRRLFLKVAVLVGGAILLAEAPAANREVEAVIHEFNSAVDHNDVKRMAALFTPNGTYRAGTSRALPVAEAAPLAAPKRLPWDERMPLHITIQSIGFLRPDIAIVEATQSDSSPMLENRTWLCRFVLVYRGRGWKISSYSESAQRGLIP